MEPNLRLLSVDLDSGVVETEERGPEYWERYVGGRGVGAKLLSEEDFRRDPYDSRMPVSSSRPPTRVQSRPVTARGSSRCHP